MCVSLCHYCFHGAKGIIVYSPSCHLIDFPSLFRNCSRCFPAGQLFLLSLELLHRVLMRPAFPFSFLGIRRLMLMGFSFPAISSLNPPGSHSSPGWNIVVAFIRIDFCYLYQHINLFSQPIFLSRFLVINPSPIFVSGIGLPKSINRPLSYCY